MGKVRRGEDYYLDSNQHVKKERIYFAKGGQTIVQCVIQGVSKECKHKVVQMKSLFHLMLLRRPMADFTTMQDLLLQLNIVGIPKKH
jgi:hypothetical protein